MEAACAVTVVLYSAELKKSVESFLRNDRQTSTYWNPSIFSSVIPDLSLRVQFPVYQGVCSTWKGQAVGEHDRSSVITTDTS